MSEIIFLIEEAHEGGYTARSLEESIYTEADDMDTLKKMIRDAIICHYESENERPQIIRLHFVKEEIMSLAL